MTLVVAAMMIMALRQPHRAVAPLAAEAPAHHRRAVSRAIWMTIFRSDQPYLWILQQRRITALFLFGMRSFSQSSAVSENSGREMKCAVRRLP
jgi:hypothetical protein